MKEKKLNKPWLTKAERSLSTEKWQQNNQTSTKVKMKTENKKQMHWFVFLVFIIFNVFTSTHIS